MEVHDMKTAMVFVVVPALILTMASSVPAGYIDGSLVESLSSLSPGQKVRVQVYPQREVTGRLSEVAGDSLIVLDRNGEHRVAQRDVAALWRAVNGSERSGKGGLAAGAVIGFAVGTVIGGEFASWSDDNRILLNGMVYGTGIGAAAGLVVGGILGSFKTDWQLEYSEPSYHPAMWSDAAPGRSPSGAISTVAARPLPAGEPRRFDFRLHPVAQGGVLLAATVRF